MFAASKTSTSALPDPQFNYVTMLLHGDGTNGAQNNTFLDSSTNNYTITRNGNTTQGSFSPYGSNWSANLPATVISGLQFDRLGTTSSFNFMHNASALWTLEVWVNLSVLPTSLFPIFSNNDVSSSSIGVTTYINSSGQVVLFITNGTAGNPVCSNTFTTTAISTNSWTHIALVYNQSLSSGNALLFINGVASGSANKTGNSPSASNASLAAELFSYATGGTSYAFNGYASNLRITNSAVYSSAFTPSTTPLTAIANTQLLTFQSNRFVDNSTNAYAIVPRTTQSIQRFNPFGTATAYSTSVIGGSGYFDGSGDYLVTSGTGSFNPRSTFTVEFWTYPISNNTVTWINSNTNNSFYFETSGTTLFVGDGFINTIGTSAPTVNQWTHMLLSFDGTTYRLFYNGVLQASSTSLLQSNVITAFRIGQKQEGTRPFNGYITDMRVLVGTALYTSAFTPPTTPITAITNTSLLLNYINGAIYDNAMMNDLETVGNAQISTSVKKFGTGSLAFDGTGDSLTAPSSVNANFGTGNFTIEMWVYANSIPSYPSAAFLMDARTNASWVVFFASNQLYFGDSTGTEHNSGTVSANAWYHIAICRSSGTTTGYINGVSAFSFSDSGSYVGSPILTIGARYTNTLGLNGYIDDLRITNGYARYTANFTPPTAAFPNTGPI